MNYSGDDDDYSPIADLENIVSSTDDEAPGNDSHMDGGDLGVIKYNGEPEETK